MYTQLGVLTKGTVVEVNVSELGMVTAGGKVVFGKYAQITNNPENDGCINAVLRMCALSSVLCNPLIIVFQLCNICSSAYSTCILDASSVLLLLSCIDRIFMLHVVTVIEYMLSGSLAYASLE